MHNRLEGAAGDIQDEEDDDDTAAAAAVNFAKGQREINWVATFSGTKRRSAARAEWRPGWKRRLKKHGACEPRIIDKFQSC